MIDSKTHYRLGCGLHHQPSLSVAVTLTTATRSKAEELKGRLVLQLSPSLTRRLGWELPAKVEIWPGRGELRGSIGLVRHNGHQEEDLKPHTLSPCANEAAKTGVTVPLLKPTRIPAKTVQARLNLLDSIELTLPAEIAGVIDWQALEARSVTT